MQLKVLTKLENRLHTNTHVDARSISIFRILFSLFVLIFYGFNFSWISEFPDLFFHPPVISIANLFNGFPPAIFFNTIDFILPLLFIILLFGFYTRAVSILISIVLIIVLSFKFSFGHIDHSIIFDITPLLMSMSPWGKHYSIDSYFRKSFKKSNRRIYGLSLLALFIGFGFLTAGLPKMIGWMDLDLDTHGVRSWLHRVFFTYNNPGYMSLFFVEIKNKIFWEIADYTAVVFEITFILACFSNKSIFRSYLALAVIFHLINFLMLNISFLAMAVVYGAFVDWNYYFEKMNEYFKLKLSIQKNYAVAGLIIILFLYFGISLFGYKFINLKSVLFKSFDSQLLLFSGFALIAVYYLLFQVYLLFNKKFGSENA